MGFLLSKEDDVGVAEIFDDLGLSANKKEFSLYNCYSVDTGNKQRLPLAWVGFGMLIDRKYYGKWMMKKARECFGKNDIERAKKYLGKVLKCNSEDLTLYLELMHCYRKLGIHEKYNSISEQYKELFIPQNIVGADFENGISFYGYNIDNQLSEIKIQYFWKLSSEAINQFEKQDLYVFVHFRRNGVNLFQNDHKLALNIQKDKTGLLEIYVEKLEFQLPKDVDKGKYEIIIGLWDGIRDRVKIKGEHKKTEIKIGQIVL